MTKRNDPIAEGQSLQAEAVKAQEDRDQIKPTPTQEEADKAKLGVLDGDFESPAGGAAATKAETAEKPATYKTRSASAE